MMNPSTPRALQSRFHPYAFTLVEVLIVVVILGILAALVVPQVASASTDAQAATALNIIKTVQKRINLHQAQTGQWPTVINPGWFSDGALPTTPFDTSLTDTVYYDTAGNPAKTHPTIKDMSDRSLKAYWYNPLNGRFHARVTKQATTAETLALYNLVNNAQLTAINQITD